MLGAVNTEHTTGETAVFEVVWENKVIGKFSTDNDLNEYPKYTHGAFVCWDRFLRNLWVSEELAESFAYLGVRKIPELCWDLSHIRDRTHLHTHYR